MQKRTSLRPTLAAAIGIFIAGCTTGPYAPPKPIAAPKRAPIEERKPTDFQHSRSSSESSEEKKRRNVPETSAYTERPAPDLSVGKRQKHQAFGLEAGEPVTIKKEVFE